MVKDAKTGTVADTVDDSVVDGAVAPTVPSPGTGSDTAAVQHDRVRPGMRVGRYEIVKLLGAGGMGIVYLAYDPQLERPVALKVLRPELRTAQARLLREGQSVARLAHPNIVRIFDLGSDGDDLFVAMEFVDGGTLGQWLDAQRRSPGAILALFDAAGRGLAAAHAAGLVHRDFKPENVLVGSDGRVVVTDFGLARLDAEDVPLDPGAIAPLRAPRLTRTGGVLGTPAYMSPEQLRGEVADARSDQFSFCVAHWEAQFGSRPFRIPAEATFDQVRLALEAGIAATSTPIPPGLARVERALRRGLSIRPADRFFDMDALLAALAAAAGDGARVPEAGERVGCFEILERIAQGSVGIGYRARDEEQGRIVALKVLPAEVARADRRDGFLRDARAAAAVVHPAIAAIYEAGTDGDVPYVAMEYVEGRTLREALGGGALAVPELLRIAIPLADALARAHQAGIVHRDLRCENVVLRVDRSPLILDLGLAGIVQASEPDGTRQRSGSAGDSGAIAAGRTYLSPEQARGQPVDPRSDLFAFGALLFELVCARPPFAGASGIDLATAILRDAPPAPSSLAPGAPLELDRIVSKCLEKDPADRYQSAAELVVDLRRLSRQVEAGSAPSAPRGRRWIAPVAGAALAAGIAVAIAMVWMRRTAPVPSPDPAPPVIANPGRKLTTTPIRGPTDAAPSPDGKTIAISRDGRLVLQSLDGGASRDLTPATGRLIWFNWFPDGTHLLLGMATTTPHAALYLLDLAGGATRALGPRVWGAVVSHDGARLATFDEGGIRVSDLDGGHARLLVGTREEAEFSWPAWSPDDRWIAYGVRGTDIAPAIRAVAADGSTDVLLVEDPEIASPSSLPDYLWLRDGRVLYRTSNREGAVLLALDVDPRSARPGGKPVRLVAFPDLVILGGATSDGKLVYSRSTSVRSTMRAPLTVAALDPEQVGQQGWRFIGRARDRQTSYYTTDSGVDRTEFLAVDASDHARVITSFPGAPISPRLSRDGTAIVYLYLDPGAKRISLRSAATSGGEPRVVEVLPYSPSVPNEFTEQLVVQLACARGAERCVLGAMEAGEQVFYDVGPNGRGPALAKLRGPAPWSWDVSPDGGSLVVASQHDNGSVRRIDLASGHARAAGQHSDAVVRGLVWVDDRSFLVLLARFGAQQLVRATVDGPESMLWTTSQLVARLRVLDDPEPTLYFDTAWRNTDYWFFELPRPQRP